MNDPREGSLGPLADAGGHRIGAVLNGTYRLEAVIGTGGMGTVYYARHVHLGNEVAIKSLVPQFASNQEAMRRFQREAKISSQLGHPNIVHVSDFNYDADGTPFMVMDLLRGETLRARIQARGRIGLAEALPLFRQLCDGLAAAHAQGVVHRDLKPENIFLCEGTDLVKILDFGVSKIRDARTQLTRPLAMLGTPYYMSPEQATGNSGDVDALSDVWALGAIAFEVLTGRAPFSADNPVAVFYKIVNEPLPAASAYANLPVGVDRVIARACAKSPGERFQSTTAFYVDLAQSIVTEDPTRQIPLQGLTDATRRSAPSAPIATPAPRRSFSTPELPATKILKQITPEAATRPGGGSPLSAPGPEEATVVRAPVRTPVPAIAQPAAPSGRRAFIDEPTRKTAPSSSDPTALVPMPAAREAPLEPPRLYGPSRTATPIVAGEQKRGQAPARRPAWQLAAIGLGVFVAVGAVTGTVALNQRRAEEQSMRQEVDRALGERRWSEAQTRLEALAARTGSSPELSALELRIAAGRDAEAKLARANRLRTSGELDGALAELDRVAAGSAYVDEARRERAAIIRAFEDELSRAVEEHRCADAQTAAGKLQALDHRPPPAAAAECHEDVAPRHHGAERAPERERPGHETPAMEAVRDPPLGEVGMVARETMTKMLATAEPFARRCYQKSPGYTGTMRLRVTAFPGSDHFVATAISTGPIEIRACLEGLLKNVRPPKVTAAISAERVYSHDGSSE